MPRTPLRSVWTPPEDGVDVAWDSLENYDPDLLHGFESFETMGVVLTRTFRAEGLPITIYIIGDTQNTTGDHALPKILLDSLPQRITNHFYPIDRSESGIPFESSSAKFLSVDEIIEVEDSPIYPVNISEKETSIKEITKIVLEKSPAINQSSTTVNNTVTYNTTDESNINIMNSETSLNNEVVIQNNENNVSNASIEESSIINTHNSTEESNINIINSEAPLNNEVVIQNNENNVSNTSMNESSIANNTVIHNYTEESNIDVVQNETHVVNQNTHNEPQVLLESALTHVSINDTVIYNPTAESQHKTDNGILDPKASVGIKDEPQKKSNSVKKIQDPVITKEEVLATNSEIKHGVFSSSIESEYLVDNISSVIKQNEIESEELEASTKYPNYSVGNNKDSKNESNKSNNAIYEDEEQHVMGGTQSPYAPEHTVEESVSSQKQLTHTVSQNTFEEVVLPKVVIKDTLYTQKSTVVDEEIETEIIKNTKNTDIPIRHAERIVNKIIQNLKEEKNNLKERVVSTKQVADTPVNKSTPQSYSSVTKTEATSEPNRSRFSYPSLLESDSSERKISKKYQKQLEQVEQRFQEQINEYQKNMEIKFEQKFTDVWNRFIRG